MISWCRSFGMTVLIAFVFFDASGQQKRDLQAEDYSRWHTMFPVMISDQGDWSVFNLHYSQGNDTLCVVATGDKSLMHRFAGGTNGQFSPNTVWFACDESGRGIALLNLKTGTIRRIPAVSNFHFSASGQLVTLSGDTLTVSDPATLRPNRSLSGVVSFSQNARQDKLAVVTRGKGASVSLQVISGDGMAPVDTLHQDTSGEYGQVNWHRQADALTFVHQDSLYFSANLQDVISMAIPAGFQLKGYRAMTLSDDLGRVLVNLVPKSKSTHRDSTVQIWHVDDTWIYPRAVDVNGWDNVPKIFMWSPYSSRIRQVSADSLPASMVTGKQDYLLSYNLMGRSKQYRQLDDIDVYLTDLKTGKTTLLIERLENGVDLNVWVSPGGRYVAYFKDHHWWSYDLQSRQHVCMTDGMTVSLEHIFGNSESDASIYPHGSAGWTSGDEGFLIYDQYDCWVVSPAGDAPRRLTDGRETQRRFRYYARAYGARSGNGREFGGKPIDLRGAIFEMRGVNHVSGFFTMDGQNSLQPLVTESQQVSNLLKAPDSDAYTYTTETFSQAPSLHYAAGRDAKSRLVHQSNSQQEAFHWGHSELIYYHNSKAEVLKGALLYPADYQPGKQYPMIVDIYQNRSRCVYEYVIPAAAEGAGINYSVYTSKGYLVFCPDINYTIGDAGMSAVDCVESGVKAVIHMGVVDPQRIGLTGHSYGGYETTFIITQSRLFAAAMAGAPITDMVKGYLTLHEYAQKEEFWRYEHQQNRYGYTFFDYPEAYYRNSPVYQAEKIQTPLFLWTGKEDRQVHWYQSIELYLALRRLGKEAVMCVYPEEHHNLMDPARQRDMTHRTLEWFDHYLKCAPAASWMTKPRNQ